LGKSEGRRQENALIRFQINDAVLLLAGLHFLFVNAARFFTCRSVPKAPPGEPRSTPDGTLTQMFPPLNHFASNRAPPSAPKNQMHCHSKQSKNNQPLGDGFAHSPFHLFGHPCPNPIVISALQQLLPITNVEEPFLVQ
jgi:hypothetical protein